LSVEQQTAKPQGQKHQQPARSARKGGLPHRTPGAVPGPRFWRRRWWRRRLRTYRFGIAGRGLRRLGRRRIVGIRGRVGTRRWRGGRGFGRHFGRLHVDDGRRPRASPRLGRKRLGIRRGAFSTGHCDHSRRFERGFGMAAGGRAASPPVPAAIKANRCGSSGCSATSTRPAPARCNGSAVRAERQ